MEQQGHAGPLAGVRIVEFDAIGPVPLAAMLLADMGADIVRIGRPGGAGAAILHRGRTHVTIDLKRHPDEALALIAQADIVLEGLRPGVMERLGLGPDACLAANPRIVYGRMTGWGQAGPLAMQAGHDINYLAITGALGAMGPADAPPPVPLNLVADYGGGAMFLLSGVLAALLSARTSGRGQVVDAAMTDGVVALTAMFHDFRHGGLWRDERQANLLDGGAPFYRCYACADGKFLSVGALEPAFYAQLLEGLAFAPEDFPQGDRARWPEMTEAFAAKFVARTRDEWAAVFAGTDACVAPVLDWKEAIGHPHNAARETFATHAGIVQPAPAPRFSATPSAIRDQYSASAADALAAWSRG